MNQSQTVFAQVVELLPRGAFANAVRRYRGQRGSTACWVRRPNMRGWSGADRGIAGTARTPRQAGTGQSPVKTSVAGPVI